MRTQDTWAVERWTDEGGRPARETDQEPRSPRARPDTGREPRGVSGSPRDDALRFLPDRKP